MRALKVIGTVVAVVGLAATGLGLALAPGAFALGLGTAGMLAVGTYAALAAGVIGLAAAAFAPKPGFSSAGNPLQFQTNPQSGIPYGIGRTRTSGVRGHADTYDASAFKSEGKQDVLAFMVVLSGGGAIEGIESFKADKEIVTFDPASGNAIGGYSNWMAQKVSLGLAGASALALAFGGGNFPGWTSAHKLGGIAHALWDLRYDQKGEKFGAGVPEPQWIGKWVKVYDPRKDSTYPGGSGSHRALDESTYEWSNNPALHALTWALGRWQNGKRTLGIGAPVANIRVADFVEAANIADANGWTCGGVEWSTDSKWAILKRMLQAGGAEPTMTGAMIGCRVNTPRVSIATVEAEDLLDSMTIAATRSRRDRFNTVIPRLRSEHHDWEVISGTPISFPGYVTEDGGQRTKEIDFPLVQDEVGHDGVKQAGQLAAYEIVNSREAGPWTFTTGPKFLAIKTGDCITLNVPDEGIAMQPVLVREVSRDPATLKFTFTVETETTSKHDFALGKTTTPPPTWTPTPPDLTPPTPADALWNLEAIDQGSLPCLLVTGACEFPGADVVLIEYRKVGDPDWISLAPLNAGEPVRLVISALDAGTFYEVRLAYRSDNRVGDWLILPTVQTGESPLENFNSRNDRDGSSISGVIFPTDGSALDHSLNQDGSANIRVKWTWAGVEDSIDGFQILLHKGSTNAPYTPGTTPADEALWELPASHRVAWSYGFPADGFYALAVRPYRKVDPDIAASRHIYGPWRQPTITSEAVYQPTSEISILPGGVGKLGGLDVSHLIDSIGNFDTRNDRDGSPVAVPTISASGSAVDHSANPNGSVNISFEWSYDGAAEATIDEFELLIYVSNGSDVYTIGTDSLNETVFPLPRSKRSFSLMGVNPTDYYTLAIRAVRHVDPDIESTRIIRSAWARPSLTSENPYRPAANPVYYGDHQGTIDGVDASIVAGATTNFNSRNDRDATAVAQPLLASGGAAIEHTLNTDGSADIRFAWDWPSGVPEESIDGFDVLVVSRSSSGAYTIGSDPSIERIHPLVPYVRAIILSGMPADRWYTLAVRARRVVDPDIDSSRQLTSAWKRPSAVDNENPYRPSSNVAFAGTFSTLPRQVAPGNLTIHRNWRGVIFGGQVPVEMKFQHLKGATDVSASATWAIEKSFGCTVSVGSGGTAGVVSITSVNHWGWFVVASTYEGVTHRQMIELPIQFAPPPVGSAPYILLPEIDGFAVSSTSVPGSLVGQFQISTGPSGVFESEAKFWGYGVDGDGGIQWQIRYRVAGVGSYVDGPAATQQLYYDPEFPRGTLAGVNATAFTLPGLSANTLYDIQIYARRSTSVPSTGATQVRAVPASNAWLGK